MLSISPINNINFTSTYKTDVSILKKDENNEYKPYEAKLVEMDMHDDKEKIKSICEKNEFSSFGRDLYNKLYDNDYYNIRQKHCYALVENSEKDLTNIDKDKVLGIYSLYELENKKIPLCIPYFMTNGEYANEYGVSEGTYSDIGSGMFHSITDNMYPDKAIYGYTAWSAMGFWEKMGMKHISERRLVYIPESKKGEIDINVY